MVGYSNEFLLDMALWRENELHWSIGFRARDCFNEITFREFGIDSIHSRP